MRQSDEPREVGKTTADIIRDDKPAPIAAPSAWEHPGLLDGQIAYAAAQPA